MKRLPYLLDFLRPCRAWTYAYAAAPSRDRLPAYLRRVRCVTCRRSLKPGVECPACAKDRKP